jgi:hypothetical protein
MKKAGRRRTSVSANTVAAPSEGSGDADRDEMRSHYDFDYSKSRPNRFAERLSSGTIAIVLDSDVANVFQSSEAVNTFLRSAIAAMPADRNRKKRAS